MDCTVRYTHTHTAYIYYIYMFRVYSFYKMNVIADVLCCMLCLLVCPSSSLPSSSSLSAVSPSILIFSVRSFFLSVVFDDDLFVCVPMVMAGTAPARPTGCRHTYYMAYIIYTNIYLQRIGKPELAGGKASKRSGNSGGGVFYKFFFRFFSSFSLFFFLKCFFSLCLLLLFFFVFW